MKVSKLRSILSALPDDASIFVSTGGGDQIVEPLIKVETQLGFIDKEVWLIDADAGDALYCKVCNAFLNVGNTPMKDEEGNECCEECIDK
jgi:hypothetical protein